MQSIELITILVVIVLAAVLAYKSSFLHNKKIGYISLLQIFYLVLVPGILYTIIFSYILEIRQRPLNTHVFLNDNLLTSLLLLSVLYTYGGIAIHGICKTFSQYFDKNQKKSLLFKVNDHFHNQFSHSLIYTGAAASIALFCLIEINHVSPYPTGTKILMPVLNGLFIGLSLLISLNWYQKKRWSELKLLFFSAWLLFIIVLYALKPYIKNVEAYPFTLMMLIAFSFFAGLSFFLYLRRIKNKIRVEIKTPKELFE